MLFVQLIREVALLAEGVDRNQWSNVCSSSAAVALLAEGVDRNIEVPRGCCVTVVALLAEGVDRNQIGKINGTLVGVALLAEGVDRNEQQNDAVASRLLSPSSRRAWIEIARIMMFWSSARVALLAEGVDRNVKAALVTGKGLCSRPPRGGRG